MECVSYTESVQYQWHFLTIKVQCALSAHNDIRIKHMAVKYFINVMCMIIMAKSNPKLINAMQ